MLSKSTILLSVGLQGKIVIGNVPACCRGGVRFKAEPHCVIIEALIMVSTAAMSGI